MLPPLLKDEGHDIILDLLTGAIPLGPMHSAVGRELFGRQVGQRNG